jgi:hypothetical protein
MMTTTLADHAPRSQRAADFPRAGRNETAYYSACDAIWYFRLYYMRKLQEQPSNVFLRSHIAHVVGLLNILHAMAPDLALCVEQAAYMAGRIKRLPTYNNPKAEAIVHAHARAYA